MENIKVRNVIIFIIFSDIFLKPEFKFKLVMSTSNYVFVSFFKLVTKTLKTNLLPIKKLSQKNLRELNYFSDD